MATNNKYDRQLRLWGPNGQALLNSAHILLINASATGSETLKNLVLPGVGTFTILDDNRVQEEDLGNNFFVTEEYVGDSRAKVVSELLVEMNPDVTGLYRDASPEQIIAEEPMYFSQFTLIIASGLPPAPLGTLADVCYANNKPLLIVQSYGLVGYLRIAVREHLVVDIKADPRVDDLRIANPFPALEAFAKRFDLATLDSLEFAHVPFVVLLIQAIARWKKTNSGKLPSTPKEKDEFKASIKAMAGQSLGLNFVEAVDNAYKSYVVKEIPFETQELFSNSKCVNPDKTSSNFWLIAAAIREFVQKEGGGTQMPLAGSIPDMTATTQWYIELQNVYRQKAEEDQRAVKAHLHRFLDQLGLPHTRVTDEELVDYCKNASYLQAIHFRSLDEEWKHPQLDEILYETDPQAPTNWYIMLRGAHLFYLKHGRYPGVASPSLEKDSVALLEETKNWLAHATEQNASEISLVTLDHAKEMVRYGACEIHNIAALVGGIASQEAVKIITKLYTPLNNTYIYNGITASAAVCEA